MLRLVLIREAARQIMYVRAKLRAVKLTSGLIMINHSSVRFPGRPLCEYAYVILLPIVVYATIDNLFF